MQTKESKRKEKKIFIPEQVMELVLDYRFQNFIPNTSQAILQLVSRGLIREKEQGNYVPNKGKKFAKIVMP